MSTTQRPKPTQESPDQKSSEELDRKVPTNVPIEHYHVEPDANERLDSSGDLEKETLDPNAPFNKTYGQEHGGPPR